ncbi:hypothetical protein ACVBKF_21355, partial [Shewanella sp. 0m-11]
ETGFLLVVSLSFSLMASLVNCRLIEHLNTQKWRMISLQILGHKITANRLFCRLDTIAKRGAFL